MNREDVVKSFDQFKEETKPLKDEISEIDCMISALQIKRKELNSKIGEKEKASSKVINDYCKSIFPYKKGMYVKATVVSSDNSLSIIGEYAYMYIKGVNYFVTYDENSKPIFKCNVDTYCAVRDGRSHISIFCSGLTVTVSEDDMWTDNTFSRHYMNGKTTPYGVKLEIINE